MGNIFEPEKADKPKQQLQFGGYKNADKPRPGYYVTPSAIFYRGERMKEVQPSTFEKLGNGWAKDKTNVFFQGQQVDAHAPTFRVENKFGIDKKNKYYRGELMK